MVVIISRSLQTYRIVNWFNYMGSSLSYFRSVITILKYLVLLILLAGSLANVTQLLSCNFDLENHVVVATCKNVSWIQYTGFDHNGEPHILLSESLLLITFALTRAGTGVFNSYSAIEVYWFIFLFAIGFLLRWFLLAKAVSSVVSLSLLS